MSSFADYMKKKKIYIETYGCTANKADSESLAGLLKTSGFEFTDSPDSSDLIVINTCIVKTPTEQRMKRRIQDLSKLGKPVIVAGCMTKISQRDIERLNPSASMIGPDSIYNITSCVESALKGKKNVFVKDERRDKTKFPKVALKKGIGIVTISIGCLGNCSYCITKFARGKLKSYTIPGIVDQITRLISEGCKEIHLTSEDNGCYGLDIGTNLSELLKVVSEIEGEFLIKVGMMNPVHIKDDSTLSELVSVFKRPKIKKFIHIPVQSGSDRILKLMRRGYVVKDVENIVQKFRNDIPDIYLSTDVIVGFPGETDDDFKMSICMLKKLGFDNVNISRFGSRPGTDAEKMEQIDERIIIERSKALHQITVS